MEISSENGGASQDSTATTVAICRCRTYDDLLPEVDRILTVMGCQIPAKAHILLKPNLIHAAYPLACTEGALILAVARWFVEQGARVAVGDSPAFGTTSLALNKLGIAGSLQAMGAELCNFDTLRRVTLTSGNKVGIASRVLDCDLLVNLPRLKAHAQTRLTCAVKNCFGTVVGLRKAWWHMIHGGRHGLFLDLLLELHQVLPPAMTLADGVKAMHVTGPIHGKPFPLGVLAGGWNPVAVDTALHAIVRLERVRSPLAQLAEIGKLNGSRLDELHFPLLTPDEVEVEGFVVPDDLNPIRFNPFRFLRSTVTRLILAGKGKAAA